MKSIARNPETRSSSGLAGAPLSASRRPRVVARQDLILTAFVLLCLRAFAADNAGETFFESKIRPLLVERCLECHGAEKQKNGLRLDSRAGWQAGGERGSPIVPGKP